MRGGASPQVCMQIAQLKIGHAADIYLDRTDNGINEASNSLHGQRSRCGTRGKASRWLSAFLSSA
jgi:hypothetical protein